MTDRATVHRANELAPTLLAQGCQISRQMSDATPQVFGTLFAEVVAPTAGATVPELPGWEVRLWPVARLGDATLEARPLYPHLSADNLKSDLARHGWSVLGPVRVRR